MAGGIEIGFVYLVEFSSDMDGVRYWLMRAFLVQDWCGAEFTQESSCGAQHNEPNIRRPRRLVAH
jgi:hypothetical protein